MHPLWYTAGEGDKFGREGSCFCRGYINERTLFPICAHVYIHSAGVGRSGTFITLDAMMERLKKRDDLNIFEFVSEMRTQRMKMVQTLVSRILSDAYSVRLALLCSNSTHYIHH